MADNTSNSIVPAGEGNNAPAPVEQGGSSLVSPSAAVAELAQHAQMMDASYRLAQVLSNTGMVPQDYRGKPDDAAAAIMYGAEIGLKPIQALQNIFVVHGRPAIYGRTMQAILVNHGFRFTTVESSDTRVTVEGVAPDGRAEQATWTIERAEQAGYTKNARYKANPQEMLYAKAVTEVSRKIAPDLLLGMPYSVEEMSLEEPSSRTRVAKVPARPAVTQSKPKASPSKMGEAVEVSAPVDVDSYARLIEQASTRQELKEIMESLDVTDKDASQAVTVMANERWQQLDN